MLCLSSSLMIQLKTNKLMNYYHQDFLPAPTHSFCKLWCPCPQNDHWPLMIARGMYSEFIDVNIFLKYVLVAMKYRHFISYCWELKQKDCPWVEEQPHFMKSALSQHNKAPLWIKTPVLGSLILKETLFWVSELKQTTPWNPKLLLPTAVSGLVPATDD